MARGVGDEQPPAILAGQPDEVVVVAAGAVERLVARPDPQAGDIGHDRRKQRALDRGDLLDLGLDRGVGIGQTPCQHRPADRAADQVGAQNGLLDSLGGELVRAVPERDRPVAGLTVIMKGDREDRAELREIVAEHRVVPQEHVVQDLRPARLDDLTQQPAGVDRKTRAITPRVDVDQAAGRELEQLAGDAVRAGGQVAGRQRDVAAGRPRAPRMPVRRPGAPRRARGALLSSATSVMTLGMRALPDRSTRTGPVRVPGGVAGGPGGEEDVRPGSEDTRMDDTAIRQWLDEAIGQAEKSWAEGGIPIGSVLVDGAGTIVARGHNERVQSGDPTAHAEVVCIRTAGRRRDWAELTLVSTLSPCPMCTGTAILFRIPRVIVGEHRTFMGAEGLMRESGIDVMVIDDERCVALMQRLQSEKPDLWAEDIGL